MTSPYGISPTHAAAVAQSWLPSVTSETEPTRPTPPSGSSAVIRRISEEIKLLENKIERSFEDLWTWPVDLSTEPLTVGLPRQPTFRRQISEYRERLSSLEFTPAARRAVSANRRDWTIQDLLPPSQERPTTISPKDALLDDADDDSDDVQMLFQPETRPISHYDVVSAATHLRPSPKPGAGRTALPTLINGIPYDALPDTMSSANIMTKLHAAKIGVPIDLTRRQTFTNACGETFESIGEIVADVAFPDNRSKIWRDCPFAVVEKLAVPLTIGDPFLRLTETLTKFRHRLKRVTGSLKRLWRVCYMDQPRRMLACSIGGQPVMASADTGSDVDLISAKYAQHRGWRIRKLRKNTGYVILADGTVKKVSGYVDVPLTIASTTIPTRLYVLDGLMCDVLLGDDLLADLDAFNRFEDHFVDTTLDEGMNVCHNINWQETIDSRLNQILQGQFSGSTAAELARSRFNRVGFNIVSSSKNIQAWGEAFKRALNYLDDREVRARVVAREELARLSGADLQRKERLETERQEKHRETTNRIKQERDRFFGVVS